MNYVINVLIAIDQLVCALFGGYPDETISSYSHRLYRKGRFFGFMRNVVNALFFWQDDHCKQAYESERLRSQMPPELR